MKMGILTLGFILAVTQANAQMTPRPEMVRANSVYNKVRVMENRIFTDNMGGLFGAGVCWWHSRLQRAIWYLAKFKPELPKPTKKEAKRIIRKLISQKNEVVIPGYVDAFDFTRDFDVELQRKLNHWEVRDGIFRLSFIRAMLGRHQMRPAKMKSHMDAIYAEFQQAEADDQILWMMYQIKGIGAHAALLISMKPNEDGGYDLETVDSNESKSIVTYHYKQGDRFLRPDGPSYYRDVTWVPYVGHRRHFNSGEATSFRQ